MKPPRSIRAAELTYRRLLRLLPQRLTKRHGGEMERLFAALVREAYDDGGAWAVVVVSVRTAADLVLSRSSGSRGPEMRRRRGPLRAGDTLGQDLRLSFREMLRRPGSALMAVASLAVGMSITVGIFTFADTVLWRDWGFHRADRVVQVFEHRDQYLLPSWPVFREIQRSADIFDGVLASELDFFAVGAGEGAEILVGERVSDDYFRVLGVPPELGRYPAGEDPVVEAGLPVVISHHVWETSFGSVPDIVGRDIRVNGHAGTVVAVAPQGLDGTKWGVSAELWIPTARWAEAEGWRGWRQDRNLTVTVMARMRDGVDVEAVDAALAPVAEALAQRDPAGYRGMRLEATDRLRGDMGPEIGVTADIIGVVAILAGVLVLLVGCGNVAGLLMARGILRTKEIAVRCALGANRGRIMRQLLTESLVLAGLATLAGLFLSKYGTEALLSLLPTFDFRVNFQTSPGLRGVVFAAALAFVAVLVSGLLPARQLVRTDLVEAMKAGGRDTLSAGRSRMLAAVVVGMVATSTLALFLAGVFARSLDSSAALNPGFATDHRVMGVLPIRLAGYRWRDATDVFEELERRLQRIPGVSSVGFATGIPLGEAWTTASVYAADRDYDEGSSGIRAFRSSVSDDYFRAMGTRLVRGRDFGPGDGAQGPWVAIVNEELAERLWPGEEAVGHRIRFGLDDEAAAVEVVGVAENGTYYMVGESPEPAVYASFRQWPQAQAMVVVEAEGDPRDVVPSLRAEVAATDPDIPLQRLRTSESHFREALWLYRLGTGIGGTVSVIALLLAGAGIYGVMSFSMSARRQEMGIRRALGARAPDVVGLSLGATVRMTVWGLLLGAVLSTLAGLALRASLPGIEPWDPLVVAVVPLVIIIVGFLSGLVPGISASRIDPAAVLKAES